MSADNSAAAQPGFFDRVFGLEKNEYVAAAWSFVYFFCVLSAYYILRPVREMLGVESGPTTLPYLFTASFIVMLFATPVFGWMTSRYPRRVFLPWVYLFFVANIVIFWIIFSQRIDEDLSHVWLGRVFFVWLSVFNLYVVSVYWSFMADIYTREQGRRLFGLLSAGGSIGALLGGIATRELVTDINFHNLFPISAALLSFAIICIWQLRNWTTTSTKDPARVATSSGHALGGHPFAGATQVGRSKYFKWISVASIIASLLGTAIYYFRAELVQTSIEDVNLQTRFFADINNATNLLTIIGQMFLVRHVVRRFGMDGALAIMPALSILCFAWLAFDPSLMVLAAVDVIRRATGFTFAKPSTDMLYSVVARAAKYKAKNFIDTTIYRLGDVVGIFTIQFTAFLGLSTVALWLVPFAALWTRIARWLGQEYRRKARDLRDKGIK